jgi:hypothetical protein
MTEFKTFRVGFTLASGGFFRKRFLGSARLQRCWLRHSAATNFPSPPAEFASGQQYKSSRWQNAIASTP